MKGDLIQIIALQPDEHGIFCAIPSVGEPIPVALIDGNLRPECFIEYYEYMDKFYRVVVKSEKKAIAPPAEGCSV